MSDTSPPEQATEAGVMPRMTTSERVLIAMAGMAVLVLFGVALYLTPDSRGFGTHEQLGLPPCTFKTLCGKPCPHCGMTTSFSLLVRGQFNASVQANPSGILLASLLVMLVPWTFGCSWTGRWLVVRNPLTWLVRGFLGYVCVTVMIWLVRTPF
ncbi:MAG: DUF2752 domain-containing protein [Planctomycetaceae bacterium]|nr:DUF2752 domain-containing protein [Planctomycetaceae bacterium]